MSTIEQVFQPHIIKEKQKINQFYVYFSKLITLCNSMNHESYLYGFD